MQLGSRRPYVHCHCDLHSSYTEIENGQGMCVCLREGEKELVRENPHEREGWRQEVGVEVCVGGAVQTMCMIVLEQKEEREQASKQCFPFRCGTCACASFRKGWGDHKKAICTFQQRQFQKRTRKRRLEPTFRMEGNAQSLKMKRRNDLKE